VDVHCLVAGFDEKHQARLSMIDQEGDVLELTNTGRASVGSGAPFSTIYFDQHDYSQDMPKEDSLIFFLHGQEVVGGSFGGWA